MPQQTNLNVSPYYDDFDPSKNYHRVLFKPGYPVQSRELTTLQSILQNQIEQFGNHIFKEGSVVIPGQLNYNNQLFSVKLENEYLGVDVNSYVKSLIGKRIKGETTGIEAKIVYAISANEVDNLYPTIFVSYLSSGTQEQPTFVDEERISIQEFFAENSIVFQSGEGIANTTLDCSAVGSGVILSSGIYFIRGSFVEVNDQVLILDPYSSFTTFRVGFDVIEETVTSDEDESLVDNAQGFSNYAAPGADRLKITVVLSKKLISETNIENFISLMEIRDGILTISSRIRPEYNVLKDELARRTSDESGDYLVKPFSVALKETLNDNLGNGGVFESGRLTYNNNVAEESLATYTISPGKAYVKGYEVETISTTFLDTRKPRTTRLEKDASISYYTGPTYTLNRVYGAPNLSLSNPFIVSLRDQRVGTSQTVGTGKEIGVARVYDFALESGSYNSSNLNLNQWDINLFDIETYTEISLNEPITLSTPIHIKGRASGAVGFLRFDVNNSGIITAYGVKGNFAIGEKFIINGTETISRVSTAVTSYTTKDVRSLSQVGTSSTIFTADVIPSFTNKVGIASITARSVSGISSITIPTTTSYIFTNNIKVGGLVGFTVPGSSIPTYNRVISISDRTVTVTGITTVTGICEGSPPSSQVNVTDLSILVSNFQSSFDNSLYTPLPKIFIKSVDLTNSNLTIRREFPITIASNQSNTISSEENETFLPFDEERYALIRSDGSFEVLSSDKFVFDSVARQLTIYGLGTNDSNARLIATLRKINVNSKVKNKNRIVNLIVDKSKNSSSGIGATTLNDGLVYGNYSYGTRVQDEEISLNNSDVTRLHAILESNNTNDPIAPSITFSNISGPTARTGDLLVGEEFIGQTSKAVGIYVERKNDSKIEFIYLNDRVFQDTERVTFKESGIIANIQLIQSGSKNIIQDFLFDYGQNESLYNYAKVIRKRNVKEPTKKLKFIFEVATFSSSDTGDITTANSYDQFDYTFVPISPTGMKNCDLIDIRPKVTTYNTTEGNRSPFEFFSRNFSSTSGCGKNILASDESILLSYEHYLPRVDRIFLRKDGVFQLNTGVPSENPQLPPSVDDAIEIATVSLPPYLTNVEGASINLLTYRRYQMRDISKLEDRIKNLETYTTLNLLEINTEKLRIKDENGLDRFKSGFFVDSFRDTNKQNKTTIVKNSIDIQNGELRPSPYTTEIDLLLGSNSLVGIGQTADPNADSRYVTDLIGRNVKRTGQLLTLNYTEVEKIIQPYATRIENVTPYLVTKYVGSIELFPSSDTWVDQIRVVAKTAELDTYTPALEQLIAEGWDPQTGFSPTIWSGWDTVWTSNTGHTDIELSTSLSLSTNLSLNQSLNSSTSTSSYGGYGWPWWGWYGGRYYGYYGYWGWPYYGHSSSSSTATATATATATSTATADVSAVANSIVNLVSGQERTGTRLRLNEVSDTDSLGDSLINTQLTKYMRSRNIEFVAKKLKPFTQLYAFFDGIDVNQFVTPKLLEISMQSGIFEVGETIIGLFPLSSISANITPGITPVEIAFRVAAANHKYGPFNSPTDSFTRNPYNQESNIPIPSIYSSTSTLLNVDISSLSQQVEGQYYGRVLPGMILRGQSSGSEAIITNVRIVTDDKGTAIGSFFIPNPNVLTNPAFETGTKILRLTNSSTNSNLEGAIDSSAEVLYYSQGILNTTQEKIVSVRNPSFSIDSSIKESRVVSDAIEFSSSASSTTSTTSTTTATTSSTATSSSTTGGGRWIWNGRAWVWCARDPLAQSFFIDEPEGVFITKVDLYFATKDDTLPVTIQLRSIELGLPTTKVYPFSEITIDPENINVSDDASVPTTVIFSSPVYLEGEKEHSIVILSDSNAYNVWISRIGEVDITSAQGAESEQVIVTSQPLFGSLYKSQNGSTWDPSQYEDLKLTLYKAQFNVSESGNINFYNPELGFANNQIANLIANPLEMNSRKVRIGLAKTVIDNNLTFGNTIIQRNSNATGKYVGVAGSAVGTLRLINTGIGYSNGSFSNVPLTSITGNGQNATANITIVNNVATGATIVSGGSGYQIGDVLSVSALSGSTLGRNLRLSISNIAGNNEIIVDQVQGEFITGAGTTIAFIATGIGTTDLNGTGANVNVSYVNIASEIEDGLHFKVNHKNHGMYGLNNDLIIQNVYTDLPHTALSSNYDKNSTAVIPLSDIVVDPSTGLSIFQTFENVSVSSTNPGYVLIGDEIIAYEGISGTNLIGITRSIDQTRSFGYTTGTPVFKYELNGISLRRINKSHSLIDVDVTERPIDLDYYYLKVNTSGNTDPLPQGQVDRSVSTSFPKLYIKETKSTGGPNIRATQNIPFEIVKPIVQTLKLTNTNITGTIRTISGRSIDGSELSYIDQGFQEINLSRNTYLSSPRLIASKINETNRLQTLPGNKSFTFALNLSSANENVSPCVDLDRVGMIFVSNRVNNPITDYINDYRASTLSEDPSTFVYASSAISLQIPASSLRLIISSYVNEKSDIRAFYAIMKDVNEEPIYYPFPGYNNLTTFNQVVDESQSSGLPDIRVLKSSNYGYLSEELDFREYEFSVNNLTNFRYFSIKLIGTSSDQAHPPRVRDLRCIALA